MEVQINSIERKGIPNTPMKLTAELAFLTHLRNLGRKGAALWLKRHYDDIGMSNTADLQAMVKRAKPEVEAP